MSKSWSVSKLLAQWSADGILVSTKGVWDVELSLDAKIVCDSRAVERGDLFVALSGDTHNALDFLPAAMAAGAVAVIVDHTAQLPTELSLPVVRVEQLAEQLSALAGSFYHHPSKQLKVLGVTGTNGKTTICQLLGQLLARLGARAATIGTLGSGLVGEPLKATGMTTADACTTQRLLAEFVAAQVEYVVMEVSSHALDQGRVAAVKFEQAIFTNLSRDHLDYHQTLQRYATAKARLFAMPGLSKAVLNSDDAANSFMAAAMSKKTKISHYSGAGIESNLRCVAAEFDGEGFTAQLQSSRMSSQAEAPIVSIRSSLLGEFNLANLMAVVSSAVAEGWKVEEIAPQVPLLEPVAGRLQRVNLGDLRGQPLIVVDYAHTPDAIEKLLAALSPVTEGQLWVVFGCGGERDSGKRPQMARAAERGADRVVVTSDNPRNEHPETIIEQILAGFESLENVQVEADRCRAIHRAVLSASSLDTVVIAGKGHEAHQVIKGEKLPFDDLLVARSALQERLRRSERSVQEYLVGGESC